MRVLPFLCCLLLVFAAELAPALPYPSRPVRFIVPYAPGGGSDVIARLLGQKLAADVKRLARIVRDAGVQVT